MRPSPSCRLDRSWLPAMCRLQRDLADLYVRLPERTSRPNPRTALCRRPPNDAELHRSLGEALLRQKKFPDAQQEFLAAVKLKPDLGEAYGDLAFAASENKNYPLVIRALDARAKLLPEVPITYFLRASAYDHLQDFKQAAANYHLFLNTANGKYPDQEWQAKHRLIAIEPKQVASPERDVLTLQIDKLRLWAALACAWRCCCRPFFPFGWPPRNRRSKS